MCVHNLGPRLSLFPASGPYPSALLFDQSLIFDVWTDPNPNEVRAILYSDGAVIDPDPRRPKISDFLEMQGGVR
jgi:hypothetical protein